MRTGPGRALPASAGEALVLVLVTAAGDGAVAAAFQHAPHLALPDAGPCERCHSAGAGADRSAPGPKAHDLCNTPACHQRDFGPEGYAATEVCTACHEKKARVGMDGNLRPFPPPNPERQFDLEFSHAAHNRKPAAAPGGCLACHAIDPQAGPNAPSSHAQCAGCHGGRAKPRMTACTGCHVGAGSVPAGAAPGPGTAPSASGAAGRLAAGPVAGSGRAHASRGPCSVAARFDHRAHRLERFAGSTRETACDRCHQGVERTRTLAEIRRPRGAGVMTAACGQCHRAGRATSNGAPVFTISGRCENCHLPSCLEGGPPPTHRM